MSYAYPTVAILVQIVGGWNFFENLKLFPKSEHILNIFDQILKMFLLDAV